MTRTKSKSCRWKLELDIQWTNLVVQPLQSLDHSSEEPSSYKDNCHLLSPPRVTNRADSYRPFSNMYARRDPVDDEFRRRPGPARNEAMPPVPTTKWKWSSRCLSMYYFSHYLSTSFDQSHNIVVITNRVRCHFKTIQQTRKFFDPRDQTTRLTTAVWRRSSTKCTCNHHIHVENCLKTCVEYLEWEKISQNYSLFI